jgi:hypothetical protein
LPEIDSPMPALAPVTRATRPLKRSMTCMFFKLDYWFSENIESDQLKENLVLPPKIENLHFLNLTSNKQAKSEYIGDHSLCQRRLHQNT